MLKNVAKRNRSAAHHSVQMTFILKSWEEINHCCKWAEHSWEWLNCVCNQGKLNSTLWSSSAGFLSSERLLTISLLKHHSSKSPPNGCKKVFGLRPSGNFLRFQIVRAICQDPCSTAYLESKQLNTFGTVFTTAAQAAFIWVCMGAAIIVLELGRILFLSQYFFAKSPESMYREDMNWQKKPLKK